MADELTDENLLEEAPNDPVDENEPLSAFDLPAAPAAPLDVRDIALDDIEPLTNVRPHHHGIEGLAATMHLDGQLQPVVVRPSVNTEHGRAFELVFGYRRFLAAESMGWDTIRAEVRDIPDASKRRQLIIENFQREQLTAVAEARAMYELKYSEDPSLSNAEVARQLGCDPSHVSHRLKMLLGLAPPKPAPRPESVPVAEVPDEPEAETALTDVDGTASEDLPRPQDNTPLPDQTLPSQHIPERNEHGELVLPGAAEVAPAGDSATDGDDHADAAPAYLDILALVDEGQISASTAEVIASLESRADQEQLTKLVLKHGWGVKKAAQWARQAEKEDLEEASDSEALGPVEMLAVDDAVELQKLRVRADVTDLDVDRIAVYALLRNGMDHEVLDYITERLGYTYETLWDYVAMLDEAQVAELKRRLAVRYISAAHRFYDLEPTLKDTYGVPEDAPAAEVSTDSQGQLPAREDGDQLEVRDVLSLPMPSPDTLSALSLTLPDSNE